MACHQLLPRCLIRPICEPGPGQRVRGAAQRMLKTERYDLCLTEYAVPDGDGLELVKWISAVRSRGPGAVNHRATANIARPAVRALKLGAFDFVSKPLDLAGLCASWWPAPLRCPTTIAPTTAKFGPPSSSARPPSLRSLRGCSPPYPLPRPVHISANQATGKELVAKLIHESGRAATALRSRELRRHPHRAHGNELFGP